MRGWVLFFMVCFIGGCGGDFFDEYYSECQALCSSAQSWGRTCGLPSVHGSCVDELWYLGRTQQRCESGSDCYTKLKEQKNCLGIDPNNPDAHPLFFVEGGWLPDVYASGCPVD